MGEVGAGGRERGGDLEQPGGAGGPGVDVGERAEPVGVLAGQDQVRPHLVGADQVGDRVPVGVADGEPQGRRAARARGRRPARRVTSRPASWAEIGGVSVVSMTDMAGRIGMPMPSVQASRPFMPWLAVSVRLAQVKVAPRASAMAATVVR